LPRISYFYKVRAIIFFFLVRPLSHHLDLLRRADLVQSRREGTFIYCTPRPDMVSELVRLLTACR
jgi:hypothetical protein